MLKPNSLLNLKRTKCCDLISTALTSSLLLILKSAISALPDYFFSLECKITSFTYASLFRYQVFLSLLLIFCIKKDLISYPHTPQFYFIFHLNLMNFLAPYFHSLGCLVFCIEILSTARDIIRIRFIPELQDRIED